MESLFGEALFLYKNIQTLAYVRKKQYLRHAPLDFSVGLSSPLAFPFRSQKSIGFSISEITFASCGAYAR